MKGRYRWSVHSLSGDCVNEQRRKYVVLKKGNETLAKPKNAPLTESKAGVDTSHRKRKLTEEDSDRG